MPDDERESEAPAPGSGLSTLASFANFDPATCSWRTSQLSLFGDSTWSSPTWPRAGTTRNGIAFPLPPSAPLTAVTGSSWLPTPSATPYGSNQSPSPGAAVRPSLEKIARMWPTPTVNDSRNGANRTSARKPGSKHHDGVTLVDAVRLWPTPGARLGDARGMPSKRLALERLRTRKNLDDAVAASSERDPDDPSGGRLNPTWVEWLMGFPLGWTDLEGSETR